MKGLIRSVLGALFLGAGLAGQAAITPSMAVLTNINCGSVIPGSSSGTLVLSLASPPSGVRSTTNGTSLGGSPAFALGAFKVTGAQGNPFSISSNFSSSYTLTGPAGATMTVAFASLVRTPNPTRFPAGIAGTATTTELQYLGLTVQVKASSKNPTGTYTGTLNLRVTDTATSLNSPCAIPVTIKVDPTPLRLAKNADLSFGAVIGSGTAGTAVLAPTGGASVTGGVTLGGMSPGVPGAFTVTGAVNSLYTITLPSTTVTLTGPAGATLTATAFNSSPSGTGVLNSLGTQALKLGATLNVAAGQAEGTYSGTYSVTVAYQ